MIKMKKKLPKKIEKWVIFVTSIVLIGLITMGGTYAYLQNKAGVLTNTFSVGKITTKIVNDDNCPKVQNIDETDCIVRMRYDISPSDALNDNLVIDSKWSESNGFYYYTGILKPNQSTSTLFSNFNIIMQTSVNKDCQIILYKEAVQSEMVDVDGNTITSLSDDGIFNVGNAEKIFEKYY